MKRGYTVTVTMTPRQAAAAADALHRAAIGRAGWDLNNHGTEDEPVWVWEKEEGAA